MAIELNMAITLTLVALIGIGAALIGIYREKEQSRYISLVTVVLNAVGWWYAVSQQNWGPLYES
jgi:hypothetical protein